MICTCRNANFFRNSIHDGLNYIPKRLLFVLWILLSCWNHFEGGPQSVSHTFDCRWRYHGRLHAITIFIFGFCWLRVYVCERCADRRPVTSLSLMTSSLFSSLCNIHRGSDGKPYSHFSGVWCDDASVWEKKELMHKTLAAEDTEQ